MDSKTMLKTKLPKGMIFENVAKLGNKPTLGKREANATPLEFRDELLRLALHSAHYR